MIPDYAILDPEMIRHLPPAIVAATGVDALAHAVECYTSLKATPLSDLYAREGARLIFHNIVKAYRDPEDMDAKKAMLLAGSPLPPAGQRPFTRCPIRWAESFILPTAFPMPFCLALS